MGGEEEGGGGGREGRGGEWRRDLMGLEEEGERGKGREFLYVFYWWMADMGFRYQIYVRESRTRQEQIWKRETLKGN